MAIKPQGPKTLFFRAMKLDDARKFVMVRDVMRLKLILDVYDANVLQILRRSHALSVAFGDPSLFIDSCNKFQWHSYGSQTLRHDLMAEFIEGRGFFK